MDKSYATPVEILSVSILILDLSVLNYSQIKSFTSFYEKHLHCITLKLVPQNSHCIYIVMTHHTYYSMFDTLINLTVLSRFLAHAPLSKHVLLLEYRHTEVNCNIYNIGAPTFSSISQNMFFRL